MGRFLVLLVCASSLAAAPVPKALKKPPLQEGLWLAVEESYEGVMADEVRWAVWLVEGEQLTLFQNTKTFRQFEAGEDPPCHTYTLRYPDSKDGRAFDLVSPGGQRGEEVHAGLMEVTQEKLTVCYTYVPSTNRPTTCAPGADVIYFSMKRLDRATLKAK